MNEPLVGDEIYNSPFTVYDMSVPFVFPALSERFTNDSQLIRENKNRADSESVAVQQIFDISGRHSQRRRQCHSKFIESCVKIHGRLTLSG